MKKNCIAIYPGTFDPITNGHLDVIQRACCIFDKLIVAIADNVAKTPLFSISERVSFISQNTQSISNLEIISFDSLTVDLAKKVGASVLIRGLRAVSDFEYEFQMAQMNRELDPQIETIFLMPNHQYFYTSSSLIKQIALYSPDRLTNLVPPNVILALENKGNCRGNGFSS